MMGIFNVFKKVKKNQLLSQLSKTNKLSIKLISVLGQVMMYADGVAKDIEAQPLISLCQEQGVTVEELNFFHKKFYENPEILPEILEQLSVSDKNLILQTLATVMVIDGDIHEEELTYLNRLGCMMNLSENEVYNIYQDKKLELDNLNATTKEVNGLFDAVSNDQKIAILYLLFDIAKSDGLTEEEEITIEQISLIIDVEESHNSKIDNEAAIDLLSNLTERQKNALTSFFLLIVNSDGKLSREEFILIKTLSSKLGLETKKFDELAKNHGNYSFYMSQLNLKQQTELPEWFNGEIYNEGDVVRNPFTGETCELNASELSVYDLVKGAEFASKLGVIDINEANDIIKLGIKWFKENNYTTYSILSLDELDIVDAPKERVETKRLEEEINNETSTLLKVYPNLKGVDLSVVKNAPNGGSPESMFCSDIDGSWYFGVSQMTMLFKAVSEENFTDELSFILEQNDIKLKAKVEKNGFVAWKGQGFQVEHAVIKGCNVIIITNEDVAPEDAAELKTTTLSKEVDLPVGYENIGIDKIYDGEKFLRANSGHPSLSIPLLFNDNDGDNYILIGASTSTIAKTIIDDIIEKNYGEEYFEEITDAPEEWEYLHKNKFFVIGYLPKNFCVRINLLHKLMKVGG